MDRVESILQNLSIEYSVDKKDDIIQIKCPIHDSESLGNSIIYKNTGVWLCFSGACHEKHGKTFLNLIRATLEKAEKPHSWNDVFNFIDGDHVVVTREVKEFNPVELFKDEKTMPEKITPSKYFIRRGYSEKSLIEYEVGDCIRGPYANRAIVPVRYVNGEYMGFSARIHWPECKACSYYHSPYETCLSKDHDFHFMYKKWYHSKGMQKSKTLYGIHKVPDNCKKIAIVEGPGDVWKLSDYGLTIVACMGKTFSDQQFNLLKDKGVEKVFFIGDKDEAGEEFKNRFVANYYKDFSIYFPKLTNKDPSEMSDEDIKKYIVDKWEII